MHTAGRRPSASRLAKDGIFGANASQFKGLMRIERKVPVETDPHQLDVVTGTVRILPEARAL
jgi:hypothetical protein